jgi:DNA-binding NarL/FixJ family response regulator
MNMTSKGRPPKSLPPLAPVPPRPAGTALPEVVEGSSEPPTPRIVTFHVEDHVLAVVTVPLLDGSRFSQLTPVERHVASLAAEGLSNAEIGRRRGTAERTIANQMASILRKLKVGSRYELAARLARCALDGDEEPPGEP